MLPRDRMITVVPPEVECRIFMYKAGALSHMAHDLELEATLLTLQVADDLTQLELHVDPNGLRVVRSISGTALSEQDRQKIVDIAAKSVLESARYPVLRFVTSTIIRAAAGYEVQGELELHGVRRPVHTVVRVAGGWWETDVELLQTDFGITPYSAFLGALRVENHVRVVCRARSERLPSAAHPK